MLGAVFAPFSAYAFFFSSILGNEVSAQTDSINSTEANNSQTMTLLQANVLPIPNDKTKDNGINANANVNIVSDNALLPATSPLDALGGIGGADFSYGEINVYVVRNEDTFSQIADMFAVSVDTILSANEMSKSDKLKEGDVLLILPFSGIEHTVIKGQTLQGIANLYKVDMDEILLANDIDVDAKLVIGEKLMIPGADLLNETKPKSGSGSIARGGGSYASMPSIVGYFKNPVPNGRKTRGITSSHKGVDIAAPTSTPIYASASGKVLTARMGWNGAFGNMIILQHPNGTRTLYAHMSKLNIATGAEVAQGKIIGFVGSTGRSTGPHLHFEVLGAKNPF
ncbi:hypothetical protein A3B85_02170 [Candidatus Nomurabacteria bacterium RIFCSPHIGHO2_02_FULL_37_13]|uniref:LysM domain-containing protein n=1 Tax=Candidatus Nomurabacteria bacterium RIFCSPHIGHO2_02_FULL_37_13 TaxID=1801750 RepID=A0A1F6W6D7_9BACT|nr:MAG: hypothetical protein A3B85_02170 [Candidatus Nomurabacteria bacterium RIFCSPHIGHO2_02_FULL_37_13]OGI88420.1 MAG: hypothetical protein A2906_00720 [Candidatus Nomurabacteria bacterium RIFCSPLOWO2_01_FULL_37_25]